MEKSLTKFHGVRVNKWRNPATS